MILCNICNKEYKRITKSHLNSKLHKENLKNPKVVKELNKSKLIKKLEYSGKQNLYKDYEILLIKYDCDLKTLKLCKNEKLSIEFIREFQNELGWYNITYNLEKLNLNTIEFIREFKNKVDWIFITECLESWNLNTIEFIREFRDELNWDNLTWVLEDWDLHTIENIREFQDKIEWRYFSMYLKKFDFNIKEFIIEFKDRLEWSYIIKSKSDYEKYKNLLNRKNIIFFKVKYKIN
jgi:hypothetical protein